MQQFWPPETTSTGPLCGSQSSGLPLFPAKKGGKMEFAPKLALKREAHKGNGEIVFSVHIRMRQREANALKAFTC
jgi:hypothetical protein